MDVATPGVTGLLLAGDAAGFIDPMTGDGIRLALAGAEIAAEVADAVLRGQLRGGGGAWRPRAPARGQRSRAKWRFNRAVRGLVGSGGARRRHRRRPRLAAPGRGAGLLCRRRAGCRRPAVGGRVPIAVSIAAATFVAVIAVMAGEALLSAYNAAPAARARRGGAGRRRLSDDALGLSARVHRDGRRGRPDRPGAATDPGRGARRLRRRQGPQGVGDRVARPALDVPRARAAGGAAGDARPVSGRSAIPTTWRCAASSSASRSSCGRRSPASSRWPASAGCSCGASPSRTARWGAR